MADCRCTVNDLQQALSDYIAIRRGLGFQFRLPASCLRNFVAFLQTQAASYITTELASMDHKTGEGATFNLGLAFGYGSAVRQVASRSGSAD